MAQASRWRATVTFRRPEQLDDDQRAALTLALPGYGVVVDDGERDLSLWMDVEAPTLRQATETAQRVARDAAIQALGGGQPVGVRVLTEADRQREMEHPPTLDLIGVAEVAELLGVSRQRVREIADTLPDFPAPVARPAMGPVFTRESVVAFEQRWERKRTGRPSKHQDQVSAELTHVVADKADHPQQTLRMMYNAQRNHDLKIDPSTPRGESLRRAIELVAAKYPDWRPRYDETYFGLQH